MRIQDCLSYFSSPLSHTCVLLICTVFIFICVVSITTMLWSYTFVLFVLVFLGILCRQKERLQWIQEEQQKSILLQCSLYDSDLPTLHCRSNSRNNYISCFRWYCPPKRMTFFRKYCQCYWTCPNWSSQCLYRTYGYVTFLYTVNDIRIYYLVQCKGDCHKVKLLVVSIINPTSVEFTSWLFEFGHLNHWCIQDL